MGKCGWTTLPCGNIPASEKGHSACRWRKGPPSSALSQKFIESLYLFSCLQMGTNEVSNIDGLVKSRQRDGFVKSSPAFRGTRRANPEE